MSFTLAIRQDMPTHLQRSPISVAWFAKVNEENEENALSSLPHTFDCTSCNIFRSAQKLHHAQSMKNRLANDSSMFNSKVIAAKDLSSVEARQVMVQLNQKLLGTPNSSVCALVPVDAAQTHSHF